MTPQGLQGGEASPLCQHPRLEKLGFSGWNKEEPQGWEGGTLRSGSWRSQSPDRARRKLSGLRLGGWHIEEWLVALSESRQGQEEAEWAQGGTVTTPLPSQDGGSGRELGVPSSVRGSVL